MLLVKLSLTKANFIQWHIQSNTIPA